MNRPPPFFAGTFREAVDCSTGKDRWLIVAATSSSSGPTTAMNSSGWQDQQVITWINRNGIAVWIDVDDDHRLASDLDIRGLPTTIAFKADKQKERIVGYQDGLQLRTWLSNLPLIEPTPDVRLQDGLARTSLDEQKYSDAADRYVWLWNNSLHTEPGWKGVRLSFLANDIESLINLYPPARARFIDIRDATGAMADIAPSDFAGPRADWVVLNRILGDVERTMIWFNKAKTDQSARNVLDHVAHFLVEPLMARKRWADLGRLYSDPVSKLVKAHEIFLSARGWTPSAFGQQGFDKVREIAAGRFRAMAVALYAGLRAAGRIAEAQALQQEALRLDPSEGMRVALDQAPARYN